MPLLHPLAAITRFFLCTIRRLALPTVVVIASQSLTAAPNNGPAPQPHSSTPIPIPLLARQPQISQAQLSPDGTAIAALKGDEPDRMGIAILDLEKGGREELRGSKAYTCRSVQWLGNQHLALRMVRDNLYVAGMYLAQRGQLQKALPINIDNNIDLVGVPRKRPGHAIFWAFHERDLTDQLNFVDLFEVAPRNAMRHFSETYNEFARRYPEPKDGVALGYGADADGELATCSVYKDGQLQVLIYDATKNRWDPLAIDTDQAKVMMVEPDRHHIWICSFTEGDGYSVRRMNMKTGILENPIWVDPTYDPGEARVHYSYRNSAIAGFSYDQKRLRNVWLLPHFASAQRAADQNLTATDNLMLGCDDKEERFLFVAQSATHPATYFLLDTTKGTLTGVANSRPWLRDVSLRPSQPISYVTRDGVKLEGYLTLPEGASPERPVPAVVLCHGGPNSRDTWTFDPEVQFLASRGYAVLQPNYRGSSGYVHTRTLADAHNYQRMHDDVTDATQALQRMPGIDSQRIAIMGASFGGYLAVTGVALEPELYRCAITNCGVFDWKKLANDAKWHGVPGEYEMLIDQLGTGGGKPSSFARLSPISAVKHIKVPVFVAHGGEDPVVDVDQSRKLVSELRKRGIPHEVFYRNNETHGFRLQRNREAYFAAVEAFLKKNL